MFLNKLSEELRLEEKVKDETNVRRNIVTEMFSGTTACGVRCENCDEERKVVEKFYSLSLPLPESSYDYYRVTIFPGSFERREGMSKIGFKLLKNSTMVSNPI